MRRVRDVISDTDWASPENSVGEGGGQEHTWPEASNINSGWADSQGRTEGKGSAEETGRGGLV